MSVRLDGRFGEGGGQILRTALAFSALLGRPFSVMHIRHGRPTPGLKAQHVHCVEALGRLGKVRAEGATVGSTELNFACSEFRGGKASVDIGTAGSVTLLMQSVLLPMMFAGQPTELEMTGGTDVRWSMPVDYLKHVLASRLSGLAGIELTTHRRGYYPKGGGRMVLRVTPKVGLTDAADSGTLRQALGEGVMQAFSGPSGPPLRVRGISHAAQPLAVRQVAERQAERVRQVCRDLKLPVEIEIEYAQTFSIGSGIAVWVEHEDGVGGAGDALGERGKSAEAVGREAAKSLMACVEAGVNTDEHLADNLVPFLGLLGGRFRTTQITDHVRSNMYVTESFLRPCFKVDESAGEVSVEI